MPATPPIEEVCGFAKDGGPNFYQTHNLTGEHMGWPQDVWSPMAFIAGPGFTLPIKTSVEFYVLVRPSDPEISNFRAEDNGQLEKSINFKGGSFDVTSRDAFGNKAKCSEMISVQFQYEQPHIIVRFTDQEKLLSIM